MRSCTTCGEEKPPAQFPKDARAPDGCAAQCKACRITYQRKHRQTAVGQASLGRWNRSAKRKASGKKYAATEKGKANDASRGKKQRATHPEKVKARYLLYYALQRGRVLRPEHCQRCVKKCTPHGHHHDYSKPYDVTWLCAQCHKDEHTGEG